MENARIESPPPIVQSPKNLTDMTDYIADMAYLSLCKIWQKSSLQWELVEKILMKFCTLAQIRN